MNYKLVRTGSFVHYDNHEIDCIFITQGNQDFFFYPLFHFGDSRWAWGNPVSYWDLPQTNIDTVLDELPSKFRVGSNISVYISFGFALRLFFPENKSGYIRIEDSHGSNSIFGKIQSNQNDLQETINYFASAPDLKDALMWTNKNITPFFRWDTLEGDYRIRVVDERYINYYSRQRIYTYKPRNFTNKEITFIKNKLTNVNYMSEITQAYYYSSDAYKLKALMSEASEYSNLVI